MINNYLSNLSSHPLGYKIFEELKGFQLKDHS